MNDLHPDYTDAQVVALNHQKELDDLRDELNEQMRDYGYHLSQNHTHQLHCDRVEQRKRFASELQTLMETVNGSHGFCWHIAVDNLLKKYNKPTYDTILVDGKFVGWYTKELESELVEKQTHYRVFALTECELNNMGLQVPEKAE